MITKDPTYWLQKRDIGLNLNFSMRQLSGCYVGKKNADNIEYACTSIIFKTLRNALRLFAHSFPTLWT